MNEDTLVYVVLGASVVFCVYAEYTFFRELEDYENKHLSYSNAVVRAAPNPGMDYLELVNDRVVNFL